MPLRALSRSLQRHGPVHGAGSDHRNHQPDRRTAGPGARAGRPARFPSGGAGPGLPRRVAGGRGGTRRQLVDAQGGRQRHGSTRRSALGAAVVRAPAAMDWTDGRFAGRTAPSDRVRIPRATRRHRRGRCRRPDRPHTPRPRRARTRAAGPRPGPGRNFSAAVHAGRPAGNPGRASARTRSPRHACDHVPRPHLVSAWRNAAPGCKGGGIRRPTARPRCCLGWRSSRGTPGAPARRATARWRGRRSGWWR